MVKKERPYTKHFAEWTQWSKEKHIKLLKDQEYCFHGVVGWENLYIKLTGKSPFDQRYKNSF